MSNIPAFLRCPNWGSEDLMSTGTTRRGKQNDQGRDGGRQLVEKPQWKRREADSTVMIDRLRLAKSPLAGSARWLQGYVNQGDETVQRQVQVTPSRKELVRACGKCRLQPFSLAFTTPHTVRLSAVRLSAHVEAHAEALHPYSQDCGLPNQ